MKSLMERLSYEAHRPRFYDKYAMVIAVCAMFGAKETNEFMSGRFASFGFNVISSLELQVATKSEKETTCNRGKIADAFDKFIAGIENGRRTAPPLDQLVRFNLFKSISEMNKERFAADYEYYKDKADIPYDGKISPLKKMLARWVAKKTVREFLENR
jgi:multimeric flavodoxin WrbA